jgi:hypothetical protein
MDYEWDPTRKRWVISAVAAVRRSRHQGAMANILMLEGQQGRAVREHLLGDPTAATRLKAIDDAIATERSKLT